MRVWDRIGLGSAQFGLEYGLANVRGRTPPAEIERILARAVQCGVRFLDTAPGYGAAEGVVGACCPEGSEFLIVTKTLRLDDMPADQVAEVIKRALAASLARLRQSTLYGLLVHRCADLLGTRGRLIWKTMEGLRADGLVRKIGVSLYAGEEIDRLLDLFRPDLVQLPVNIFDQRLIAGGHLARLKEAGVEIHARSVFLQGLLLAEPERIPPRIRAARPRLLEYRSALATLGLSPVQAALGFVLGLPEIDCAICGVEDLAQWEEILEAAAPVNPASFAPFALGDAAILHPQEWKLGV